MEYITYPNEYYIRDNYNAPAYCEIAMEAYYDALEMYADLDAAEWNTDDATGAANAHLFHRYPDRIRKKVMTTVVFSAFAAESFINDYLAVRIGSDTFEEKIGDNGRFLYKLSHALKDILKVRNHWELEWYKEIRDLFVLRNSYAHSKSVAVSVDEFVDRLHGRDAESYQQAIQRVEAIRTEDPQNLEDQYKAALFTEEESDRMLEHEQKKTRYNYLNRKGQKQLRRELENAQSSLIALCNMTRAFQKLDPNCQAFQRIFSPSVLMFGEDDEKAIRMKVFPEIGLKLKKVDLSEYAKQFQSNE